MNSTAFIAGAIACVPCMLFAFFLYLRRRKPVREQYRRNRPTPVRYDTEPKVRKIPVVFLSALLLVTPLIQYASTGVVSAAQAGTVCTPTYLEQWDWPAAVKAKVPDFDYDKGSYLLANTENDGTIGFSGSFRLYMASGTEKVHMGTLNGQYSNGVIYTMAAGKSLVQDGLDNGTYITSIPKGVKTVNAYPQGAPANQFSVSRAQGGLTATAVGIGFALNDNGAGAITTGSNCIVGARNVIYDSDWQWEHYPGLIQHGEGSGNNCKVTDLGCMIGKIGNTIGNAMSSFGQEVLGIITTVFAPDPDKTQASFDGLQQSLNNKLGFLAYPFTFMSDFFGSFNASASGCTTTSCTRNFGTFQGKPFTYNLSQIGVTMPTLWTFLLAAIRGITVLGLIFAIRSKYLEVMKK